MKAIQVIIIALLINTLNIASQTITLKECIDAALNNKAGIMAVRTDAIVSGLQSKSELSGYLPQVSVNYDYRYFVTRPSQIIPVGLFSEVPSDEKRAIQFGTPWQQNAGINLYQPLVDLSIASRIAESKINEKISTGNVTQAEYDLKSEVMQSYTRIWILSGQLKSAALDTARTNLILGLFMAKADEGQISVTELNVAKLNHNNAAISFGKSYSELLKEKIYLGFLTGFPIGRIMDNDFDYSYLEDPSFGVIKGTAWDSLPEVSNLRLQAELLQRQVTSERNRYMPVIGIEGFLGASQYSYDFDPLDNTSWYGTSYLGLNIKLPLITGENKSNRIRQLKLQTESVNAELTDRMNLINATNNQITGEIAQLEREIELIEENIKLLNANYSHYQARISEGQANAAELLEQYTELQKETERLNETKATVARKKTELIAASGMTDWWLNSLIP